MTPRLKRRFSYTGLLTLAVAAGCSGTAGEDPPTPDPPAEDFVSGLPFDEGETLNAGANDAAESGDLSLAPAVADANRAIAEADIIQVSGDTLYALSEYSGLTLVDISDPTDLRVLGDYKIGARPFEMYLDDDVVLAMYNGYSKYVHDEETQSSRWVTTGSIVALDTSDPANIQLTGDFEVPGDISDSRRVGDVLYLASHEWGCWRCSDGPSTVLTSFDVENPEAMAEVDQLRIEEDPDTYLGQRSITVTQERIYIGGREWDWESAEHGTISVVDISDPEGELSFGAEIEIEGHIASRWQMDEHNGVLRVLSQWDTWRADSPPKLQTFRVNSASDIEPLASLTVTLPRPEVLQSVRFDGDRGYAITFERTDPLFTFDLTDPAAPEQVGELEIPGWVYHMEPRGDRLYGIGFDPSAEEGSLHVSLFDVEDLATPTMLQRVNFGGDWGSFAEDQDRIHKSFKLLDDIGMIVVPFSGWDNSDQCRGEYQSGIQLVDYTEDDLTLRGVAPQLGEARRALIHRDYLLGIGDNAIQTFDISDRDQPQKVDTLEVARNISTVRVIGDNVLRFGNDWWTDRTILDLTTDEQAARAEPGSEIDLSELVQEQNECDGYGYWGNVYVKDEVAYVARYQNDWSENDYSTELEFFVIDLSADAPEVLGTFSATPQGERAGYSGVVMTDSALLVGTYQYDPDWENSRHTYEIFDIRAPETPVRTTNFEVPEALAEQGWGRPVMGCGLDFGWGWGGWGYGYSRETSTALVSGDIVASSHVETLEDGTARGRYFLDRLDVSDPESPRMLDAINIPGSVIHLDADTGLAITMEYEISLLDVPEEECWENADPNTYYQWEAEECRSYVRHLNALRLNGDGARRIASLQIDDDDAFYMQSLAITSERVFIKQSIPVAQRVGEQRVRVLATAGEAPLSSLGTFASDTPGEQYWDDYYWGHNFRARGTRAFDSRTGELIVYDATDSDELKRNTHILAGYHCQELEVRGDRAYCAQGQKGVQVLDLD